METSIKKLPKFQVELEIKISPEEFNKFIDEAILKLGRDLRIEGFRKGKAPKEIIKGRIAERDILTEAANIAIKENYKKAIRQLAEENEIEPISQPEITILKLAPQNPFIFRVKIMILPEIDLPNCEKIVSQIKRKEIFVSEDEIKDSLNWLRKSRAKFSSLEREAQKKDFVRIEYESSQINHSQKIKDAFVLGEGKLISGFEEKLVGMKSGQEREFSLTFPKNSLRKELAGKEIKFKVKVKAVEKIEFPEIDDDFAYNLGKFENLNSLKENIKKGLKIEKELQENQRLRKEILEKIAQDSKFEVPEILIEMEKKQLIKDLKEKIEKNFKVSFNEYLASIKKNEEDLKISFLKEAKRKVKNFLILREIGKREKISVNEEEIKEELIKTLKKYPPDEREKLDLSHLKEYIKEVIYNEKVFQKLENFSN